MRWVSCGIGLAAAWEEGFRLWTFCQREGHCCVPGGYRDLATGYRLGSWINNQRSNQKTTLPAPSCAARRAGLCVGYL